MIGQKRVSGSDKKENKRLNKIIKKAQKYLKEPFDKFPYGSNMTGEERMSWVKDHMMLARDKAMTVLLGKE